MNVANCAIGCSIPFFIIVRNRFDFMTVFDWSSRAQIKGAKLINTYLKRVFIKYLNMILRGIK
jgi:hypothetical protein